MKSIQSLDDIRARRLGEAVVRRMEWIENRLYWTGTLRRRDVCSRFSISPQQASLDIATYLRLRPANLTFEHETKSYLKGENFDSLFPKNAEAFLEGEPEQVAAIRFERVASPWKPGDETVLAALIASSQSKLPLNILYLSLRRKSPIRRTISPHTIVEAEGRMHVRAFDHERRRFSDFLVTRIAAVVSDASVPWVDQAADADWHEIVEIGVLANPEMSKSQRQAAMRDIGLPLNGGAIRTRRALVFYVVRALRLVNIEVSDPGRRYTCANPGDVEAWIGGKLNEVETNP